MVSSPAILMEEIIKLIICNKDLMVSFVLNVQLMTSRQTKFWVQLLTHYSDLAEQGQRSQELTRLSVHLTGHTQYDYIKHS